MFNKCYKLKKIDVSKFDTSKCENISAMFQRCENIEEIDMINWDMSNLKYENEFKENPIECLFNNCKKLKKIKGIENFNTKEVLNMIAIFNECNELEELDLSNFNT